MILSSVGLNIFMTCKRTLSKFPVYIPDPVWTVTWSTSPNYKWAFFNSTIALSSISFWIVKDFLNRDKAIGVRPLLTKPLGSMISFKSSIGKVKEMKSLYSVTKRVLSFLLDGSTWDKTSFLKPENPRISKIRYLLLIFDSWCFGSVLTRGPLISASRLEYSGSI